ERQRKDGEHAAAARSYAAAYRGLSDADKYGLLGELAVDNALVAHSEANETQAQELASLEELAALLDDFITVRTRAHEAGEAEAVPERLVQELEWLRVEIDEQQRPEPGVARGPAAHGPAAHGPTGGPSRARSPRSNANLAILSGGAIALVGGVALLGTGAWNFAAVNRESQARLDALDSGTYSPQRRAGFEAELSAWQDQWRGTATGLVVAGSLLAAAGIGLTTWGVLRMRSDRSTARRWSVGVPMIVRGGLGMMVSVGAGPRRN
ncbi:MAG: hypothetical protein AB1Z98_18980, partial [Nannocystaceae bacterium]